MTRECLHCKRPFEVDEALDAKIRARMGEEGHGHLVCAVCVMARLDEMYAEQVMEMTDEEIEAELRADGVDVEAFAERTRKLLLDAMAKRGE